MWHTPTVDLFKINQYADDSLHFTCEGGSHGDDEDDADDVTPPS